MTESLLDRLNATGVSALRTTLRAVLDLHTSDGKGYCNGCDFPFPCPTVNTITEALNAP